MGREGKDVFHIFPRPRYLRLFCKRLYVSRKGWIFNWRTCGCLFCDEDYWSCVCVLRGKSSRLQGFVEEVAVERLEKRWFVIRGVVEGCRNDRVICSLLKLY